MFQISSAQFDNLIMNYGAGGHPMQGFTPMRSAYLSSSASMGAWPKSFIRYELEVVQQPSHARMCGFGDKDRRQLSPPPSIKLHMYDARTGVEYLDISGVDKTYFVVMVELWSADGRVNMSMVDMSASGSDPTTFYNRNPGYLGMNDPQVQGPSSQRQTSSSGSRATTLVRNLIGTLAVPAYKLTDLNNLLGIWFVPYDLSVRTEGIFRLKFSFMNLAEALPPDANGNSVPAPVHAQVFSEPFRSYNAQSFPGVSGSTTLSRHFANQGVKLRIRSEKKRSPS